MTEAPLFALANPPLRSFQFQPGAKPAAEGIGDLLHPHDASLMTIVMSNSATRSDRQPLPPPRSTTVTSPGTDQLVGQLFDTRALAKQIAASLSMHLSDEWRGKVYRQIDELLDATEWEVGSGLLDPRSMRTFLRFVIFAGVKAVPSLGLSPAGNIVAAWRRDTRRLTMEFLPMDRCRVAISHFSGDDPSIFTFSGPVTAARSYLLRESFNLG